MRVQLLYILQILETSTTRIKMSELKYKNLKFCANGVRLSVQCRCYLFDE